MQAQEKVYGRVLAEDGKGICFATVYLKDLEQQVLSNEDGTFTLSLKENVKQPKVQLVVWAFGYERLDTTLNWINNTEIGLEFTLVSKHITLREVEVLAVREKPLLKEVLDLKDNYKKEGYYANFIASRSSVRNNYAVEDYSHLKGVLAIPQKAFRGSGKVKMELKSFIVHKYREIDKGLRFPTSLSYPVEQAYNIFDFLKELINSNDYNLSYEGISVVDTQDCYHIVYSPRLSTSKKRLYTGYFDICKSDLAVIRFYQEFKVPETKSEKTYNYDLGMLAIVFGIKGYWLEEKLVAQFKKHQDSYVLDEVNYTHKMVSYYKRGRKDYLNLQLDVDCLEIFELDQLNNFTPTTNDRISKDSFANYADKNFWDQYFKLTKKDINK